MQASEYTYVGEVVSTISLYVATILQKCTRVYPFGFMPNGATAKLYFDAEILLQSKFAKLEWISNAYANPDGTQN